MVVMYFDNKVNVIYNNTHIGHEDDSKKLLTDNEEAFLVSSG